MQVIEPPRPGKRRLYSAQEKLNFLQEAEAPGSSMSAVARRYGISPNQLFRWRRFRDEGTLTSLLGKKTTKTRRIGRPHFLTGAVLTTCARHNMASAV